MTLLTRPFSTTMRGERARPVPEGPNRWELLRVEEEYKVSRRIRNKG